ncbi:MAG: indole-3-glycerol phosphate synthase TrpC [Kingella oralis]
MTDILAKILATKAEEIAAQKAEISLENMKVQARTAEPPRDFIAAIRAKHAARQPAIIAEIKKASPSKGLIRPDFHPDEHAKDYEAAGVACLSVLTDEPYFQGSPVYLRQARAWGADAVLLIAAALDETALLHLEGVAHSLNMAVLVELHDESEVQKCARMTTPLRGVNNRNLHTFEVDLQQTIALLPQLGDSIVVTESGITSKDDVQRMQQHGVNTFLIGETFMRANDIVAEVRKLF